MSAERDSETSGKQTLLTTPAEWIDREEEDAGFPVDYKITSTPNDFNINTLFDLIESETVKIPGFQRNYVWDIKKASKLIESIIMRLPGLNYETLEEDDKTTLKLRPIRCVVIIQHEPKDDTSMYEIFVRLNTGGINLTPQEIRVSMYYSKFYDMLSRVNLNESWRRL